MADHVIAADTIREKASTLASWSRNNSAGFMLDEINAALDALVAERDEARRDWQMYVHEVEDEKARADGAEAEADRLRGVVATLTTALDRFTGPGAWRYVFVDGEELIVWAGSPEIGPNSIARDARAALVAASQEETTT